MPDLVFHPSVQQMRFMQATQMHVCYGGARGGGKSWVVRANAIKLAYEYPGIKILIVRRTFRELDNNHIQPLLGLLNGLARYNRQDKRFTFPNGSQISFGYCSDESSLGQYQGAEHHIVCLDESTNLRWEWIEKIRACCRSADDLPKRMYYTCNPGGVSHVEHKTRWIDRKFTPAENPDDYVFIKALPTDNRYLVENSPDYIRQLEALPPRLRKMWLEGSWDVAEGMVFDSLVNRPEPWHHGPPQWTHVIQSDTFRLPTSWEIYRAHDWGYRRPSATLYIAVDYDGRAYVIDEFYTCQRDGATGESIPNEGLRWSPDRVYEEMAAFEAGHPLLAGREIHGIADPAIWDAEMGESIAEVAARCGIFFAPGDHKRFAGLMQCQLRLRQDDEGYAMLYILDRCRNLLRTLPSLQYDEHKPEDVDTSQEDHLYDALRYFCMYRAIKPQPEQVAYAPKGDPLDMFTDY